MSDERPLTPEEITEKRARYQRIAEMPYTGSQRKPGRAYHDWADARDAALRGLRRLDRIEAYQRRTAAEQQREELAKRPATELEQMMGITLEDLLREHSKAASQLD